MKERQIGRAAPAQWTSSAMNTTVINMTMRMMIVLMAMVIMLMMMMVVMVMVVMVPIMTSCVSRFLQYVQKLWQLTIFT